MTEADPRRTPHREFGIGLLPRNSVTEQIDRADRRTGGPRRREPGHIVLVGDDLGTVQDIHPAALIPVPTDEPLVDVAGRGVDLAPDPVIVLCLCGDGHA